MSATPGDGRAPGTRGFGHALLVAEHQRCARVGRGCSRGRVISLPPPSEFFSFFSFCYFLVHRARALPLAVLFVHRAHERAVPWVTFMPENLVRRTYFSRVVLLTLLILLYSFCAKKERVGTYIQCIFRCAVFLYAVIPEMADSFPDTNGPPNHVLIIV